MPRSWRIAGNPSDKLTEEHQLSLAITALEKAATPAEVVLAFKDAAAGFARTPSAQNARKVEVTVLALRHHQRQAQAQAATHAIDC